MKSHSHLFELICSFENLYLASKKAEKGKRFRHEVAAFNARREENLIAIQNLLRAGEYPFGNFRTIKIVQPKPRLISAAPYSDRVVHHALINIIGPLFERKFIRDSYANQTGKGTHAALDRGYRAGNISRERIHASVQAWLGHARHGDTWGLRRALFRQYTFTRPSNAA